MISGDNKPIVFSAFKAFADKCKRIFRPANITLSGLSYLIKTSEPWSEDFCGSILVTGLCGEKTLRTSVEFTCKTISGNISTTGQVCNFGTATVTGGGIYIENNKICINVILSDTCSNLNADASFTKSDSKTYNKITSIELGEEFDITIKYPALLFAEDPLSITDIRIVSAQEASDISFYINKNGLDRDRYSYDKEFSEIYKAKQLSNSKNIELTGAVTGNVTTDFSEDVTIETVLDVDNQELKQLIVDSIPTISVPKATTSTYGTIKLGNFTDAKYLNLKVNQNGNAYVELPESLDYPYVLQIDNLDLVNNLKDGQIVEYTGDGLFYQVSKTATTRTVYTYIFSPGKLAQKEVSDASYASTNSPFKQLIDNNITNTTLVKTDGVWTDGTVTFSDDEISSICGYSQTDLASETKIIVTRSKTETAPEELNKYESKVVSYGYTIDKNGNTKTFNILDGVFLVNSDRVLISHCDNFKIFENGKVYQTGNAFYGSYFASESVSKLDISADSMRYINFSNLTKDLTLQLKHGEGNGGMVSEVVVRIVNVSENPINVSIVPEDSDFSLTAMTDLTDPISAGKTMEIVFTFWNESTATYNGGYSV